MHSDWVVVRWIVIRWVVVGTECVLGDVVGEVVLRWGDVMLVVRLGSTKRRSNEHFKSLLKVFVIGTHVGDCSVNLVLLVCMFWIC